MTANDLETSEVLHFTSSCIKSKERFFSAKVMLFFVIANTSLLKFTEGCCNKYKQI